MILKIYGDLEIENRKGDGSLGFKPTEWSLKPTLTLLYLNEEWTGGVCVKLLSIRLCSFFLERPIERDKNL